MATKKKNTLNEDVDLLNEGEKASETPATLVSPSPDQEYNKDGALLSPNPAKSGFTSQRVVDALPATGEYNVIYIVPIKNNGGIIGYRKWRWDVETSSYKRVYGSIPNLALDNGVRGTLVINSNPNRNSTKVFNEDVVFNGQVKIGGKLIEDYIEQESGSLTNLENGTGTNAARQAMADATVNFAGRNPNAEALDPTISTTINTGASGSQSIALNKNTMALGSSSLTNGNKTIAKGDESHAEGYQSAALGNGSHAEGNITVAYGVQSHSEGYETQALGDASHSEGSETVSKAFNSHAEGYKTTVQDNYLVVDTGVTPDPTPTPEPSPVTPEELDAENGKQAHSEGALTFAFGVESHAEGDSTKTYGMGSHAEGCRTQTGELIKRKTEGGKDYYTVNHDKQYQHAEGIETTAIGRASHAEGIGTIANQPYQHVSGKYNDNKTNTLFEVGNGNANDARSNAFEVYADGTLGISNFDSNGNKIGIKRIKCINGVLTVID